MGRRGPPPRSGVLFEGREVVLRSGVPSIRVAPGAPERALANTHGYVAIHRLVASRHQPVTRADAVELIDGNPWNWQPSNLRVRKLAAVLPSARQAWRDRQ